MIGRVFLFSILILCVFSVFVSAEVNPYATGHEWMQYSQKQKTELIDTLYYILKVDRVKYPAKNGIVALDVMYSSFFKQAQKLNDARTTEAVRLLLDMPCIKVLADILASKE